MASSVTVQVLGGQPKAGLDLETVQDAFEYLELDGKFTATVNGQTASMDQELRDYQFVAFAPAVKGGC